MCGKPTLQFLAADSFNFAIFICCLIGSKFVSVGNLSDDFFLHLGRISSPRLRAISPPMINRVGVDSVSNKRVICAGLGMVLGPAALFSLPISATQFFHSNRTGA